MPDDVKAAFDRTFKGQNKSAVIAELMRRAIGEAKLQQRREEVFRSLTKQRSKRPSLSDAELRKIRRSGDPEIRAPVTYVLDASVIVKWLLQDPQREADSDAAIRLVETVVSGAASVLQPSHWLVEVGAVLARTTPRTAPPNLLMLSAMELPAADDPRILRRACEMAVDLKQHLFDTLYHAVALEAQDAVLITADERYFRAARAAGGIARLKDWIAHGSTSSESAHPCRTRPHRDILPVPSGNSSWRLGLPNVLMAILSDNSCPRPDIPHTINSDPRH